MDDVSRPSRICVVCQRDIPDEAAFCPNCGHNYSGPASLEMGHKVRSALPIVGGLAVLIAGLIHIANGVAWISTSDVYYDEGEADAFNVVFMYAIVSIASGLIAVAGGLSATKSRNLAFSLAGGFAAFGAVGLVLSGVPTLFNASSLALAGLIIIAIAHEEFDS